MTDPCVRETVEPEVTPALYRSSVTESHCGRFNPQPMLLATVLYRSVSLPELEDIYSCGVVVGGQNKFNPVDSRPDVFFSDVLDARLVRQGEDTYRQAFYHAQFHPAAARRAEAFDHVMQCAEDILSQMVSCGIRYDPDDGYSLEWGAVAPRLKRSALGPEATRASFKGLFRRLAQLNSAQAAAADEHCDVVIGLMAEYEASRKTQPITSAVLITKPIVGGLIYSEELGLSGHGEREFGFEPGQIKLDDIAEIILIKAGTEAGRCGAQGGDLARQAMSHSPNDSN